MKGFVTMALLIMLSSISALVLIGLNDLGKVTNTVEMMVKNYQQTRDLKKSLAKLRYERGSDEDNKLNLRYLINERDQKLMQISHPVYQGFLRVHQLTGFSPVKFSSVMESLLRGYGSCSDLKGCLNKEFDSSYVNKLNQVFRFDNFKLRPQASAMNPEQLGAYLNLNQGKVLDIQNQLKRYESGEIKTSIRLEAIKAMADNVDLAKKLAAGLSAGNYMNLYSVPLIDDHIIGQATYKSERGKLPVLVEREFMIFGDKQ